MHNMRIFTLYILIFKMAAERERRVNAGRNISKLIEQEITGDEFYQTAYGGFEEASEDEEYQVGI